MLLAGQLLGCEKVSPCRLVRMLSSPTCDCPLRAGNHDDKKRASPYWQPARFF